MKKPVILSYGSCQADNVARLIKEIPFLTDRFDVVAVSAFGDPLTGERAQAPPEIIDSCEFLFYQAAQTEVLPAGVQDLISRRKGIRYANLFCQVVWPQHVERLAEDARSQEFPFGFFPYGDTYLLDLADSESDEEEVLRQYLRADFAELYPLDSLADRWLEQMRYFDSEADIPLADFVWNKWREARLFWTANHPANLLLSQILQGLLKRSFASRVPPEQVRAALEKHELDQWVTPVHPSVARFFDLQWTSTDVLHKHRGLGRLTLEEWALAYIRRMRAVRARPQLVSIAQAGSSKD